MVMAQLGASSLIAGARCDQPGMCSGSRSQVTMRSCSTVAVRRPHGRSANFLASRNGCSPEAGSSVPLLIGAVRYTRKRRADVSVAAATPAVAGGEYGGGDAAAASSPEEPVGIFGLPQRWILVAAASLAFVLCNMDKVRHKERFSSVLQTGTYRATRGIQRCMRTQ